ncbi:hypothetical protein CHS0354_018361 [Potamilus streckersoni]|uniref:Uncharacterized protein n=1 Tax=Potamilus streckersoni TaxID=2493646 RepID=A0AAE0WAT7_9BIVA|nr:hypothetical protein CHS0354_018361 [Potamilus streckersoni]
MTVYFDENRADVYPNTADNRRIIMGTELGFDDMLTVFSGRLTEANQAHWEFNAEEKVLSHALYTVKNISPSNPNSQTAEQPEALALPSVRFENYAVASGIRFPEKSHSKIRRQLLKPYSSEQASEEEKRCENAPPV